MRAHKSTFRHLCAFSYETYTFFSGCSWVSILGNFLWRIYSHSQKSDWVQKVRGHSALPGTCVHFHVYLHIFPEMDDDGCHFWVIFSGQFIWILKNAINCKTCMRTEALFSTCAHFLLNLHFFQVVLHGFPYSILLLKEFILIVKKCTRLQNQAHACTYKHIIWIVTFSASSYYTKGSRKKQGFFNGSARD